MNNDIEDRFSDFWEKIDKNCKKSGKKPKKTEKSRIPDYIATIIINAVLLWVAHKLPEWTNFLTNSYQNALWVFNIFFVAAIILNFLFLFLDKIWFRVPMQLILNVIGFFAWFNLYHIYPFDFSHSNIANIDTYVHLGIIFVLVGIGVGTLAEIGRLIYKLIKREER